MSAIINACREQVLAAIRDLNDADDDHTEMRCLIAANLAYVNKCATSIDSDPRTVAGLLSLPVHQLAHLAGLAGRPKWKHYADDLNNQKAALSAEWNAAVYTSR